MKPLLDEEKLHVEAIDWLSAERSYLQTFGDPDESTKARFDSIGTTGGQPCFVEVECSVGPAEARHIESKISGSLRGHADIADRHPQFTAMRTIWDEWTVPLIATLARNYTERGFADLAGILRARSREWMFDYEIWAWTDDHVQVLAREVRPVRHRKPSLNVEEIRREAQQRTSVASLEALRTLAADRGVRDLFNHAIEVSTRLGFRFDYRTEHVTVTPVRGRGWLPLLPRKSGRGIGLVFDAAWPIVPGLEDLPLIVHGRGRFSYSRYSTGDAEILTRVLRAARAAASGMDGSRPVSAD